MTSNLKYTLTANTDAIGINHSTNETFTFNTGSVCGGGNTNADCIMNGNTAMTEQVTNGGYYYSWYAATAGTGTASMASGDATGSICPKGWRLPASYTSDSNKSYGSITDKYLGFHVNTSGDYTAEMEGLPFQSIRAGRYSRGSPLYVENYANYWSSSVYGKTFAYNSHYTAFRTDPQTGDAKYQGFPVRCVAR